MAKKIEAVYSFSQEAYGNPRVYREFKAHGVACNENRVALLMRLRNPAAKQLRRYKCTTKCNKARPVAPNLLKRDFTDDRPDHKWLSDITYIPTLAIQRRQPEAGLIHHSDQGSQYRHHTYQALLEAHGIRASMNSVGSW